MAGSQQNKSRFVGARFFNCKMLNCNTNAGGEGSGQGGQGAGAGSGAGAGGEGQDALKALNLDAKQLEVLKGNEALLGVVTNLLKEKRSANEEAKKHREEKEAADKKSKEELETKLKKSGDFEKLYTQLKEETTSKETAYSKKLLDVSLQQMAAEKKLKKIEYLKMFDQSKVRVEVKDGEYQIIGLKESFEEFAKANPEFFGETKKEAVPATGGAKPTIGAGLAEADIETLKKRAEGGDRMALAQYWAKMRPSKQNA